MTETKRGISRVLPRAIPLAAAASTLTFGTSCGKDDPPLGDGEQLAERLDSFTELICNTFQRCSPDEFSYYWDNPAECVRYYDTYYSTDYYAIAVERAPDPAGCEAALINLFDCYASLYNVSCEVLYCDSYVDASCETVDPCEVEEEATIEPCGYYSDYYSSDYGDYFSSDF